MAYLIDSDWVIDYLDSHPDAVRLVDGLMESGVAVSIIAYVEVYEGLVRAGNPAATEYQFEALVASGPLLPVSVAVARRCARLRAALRRQGSRVSSRALDLLIAATALEHDLTLVTRNTQDYTDIPELKLLF